MHAGIISIDFALLTKMLDFKGGTIHRVYTPDDVYEPSCCHIVMVHPDLPETVAGEKLQEVTVSHHATYGKNGVVIKIERVNPPKES